MPFEPSALERWFTHHPGPHAHGLAGTAAAPPDWETFARFLPADWAAGIALGYAEPEGEPALREAIAEALRLPSRANVLLTQGAVEANWLALAALVKPRKRIALMTPVYAQLHNMAVGFGGQVIPWHVPEDPNEPADVEGLLELIAARLDLVVLNLPHNPTGRVLSTEDLGRVIAACRETGARALVDEVYRDVGEAELPSSALAWGPAGVVIAGSLSKATALPGLRLGWLAGDAEWIAGALPWREQTTLALAGPATALAHAFWPRRAELVRGNQLLIAANRRRVLAWLATLPGWTGSAPATAGVMLANPGRLVNDRAVARTWYENARGMVLPGTVCGYPGRFRIGFGHRDPAALEAALASFAATAQPAAR